MPSPSAGPSDHTAVHVARRPGSLRRRTTRWNNSLVSCQVSGEKGPGRLSSSRHFPAVTVEMALDDSALKELNARVIRGDASALGSLLECYRPRLRMMVRLRMDRFLQTRVDASDVLQEAFLEASSRLSEFIRNPAVPFYLWLRTITGQQLLAAYRRHCGTQGRDARREISP